MNLFFRLFVLLFTESFRSRLEVLDTGTVSFRAYPSDLDLNFHVNNGIYFSLMDLGRLALIFRGGHTRRLLQQRFFSTSGELCAVALVKAKFKQVGKGGLSPAGMLQLMGIAEDSPPVPDYVYNWCESENDMYLQVA